MELMEELQLLTLQSRHQSQLFLFCRRSLLLLFHHRNHLFLHR